MPPPDLHTLLGQVRLLTQSYMAGKDPASFRAFRDLIQILLGQTILPNGIAVRLSKGPRRGVYALGGYGGPTDPLRLNDGRYLRTAMTLFLTHTADGPRVKVETSSL